MPRSPAAELGGNECLEKAAETGLRQKGWFDHDSNLDSLRSLPRFHRLMERLAELAW